MTRWHDPFCVTPDVFVNEDQIPSCRACGRTCPPVEDLIALQEGVAETWKLPVDGSPGQMNLWWPESVPYLQEKIPESLEGSTLSDASISESHRHPSDLYGPLKATEFRLASLWAVSDPGHPLHLSLETFADDKHPEYECTSYSWGGEDGDSSLCRPLFIGDYWDVLMQTKNCWSMLRFLRPHNYARMIWVDAVCINQANTEERGAQVAKMRKIYESCSRVVVYLGEDLVVESAQYPRSLPLDEFKSGESNAFIFPVGHQLHKKDYSLEDIVSRRYFGRIWVIQELIVSERALIRIGTTNFRADSRIIRSIPLTNVKKTVQFNTDLGHPNRTSRSILRTAQGRLTTGQTFSWLDTSAPWLQHLARKVFPSTEIPDLTSLLQLTARSSASDPRDRLFGVVSLLQDSSSRTNFAPNYALSFQHFIIGLLAHLLIREGRYWFLGLAGVGTPTLRRDHAKLPSWIPDCRSDNSWRELWLQVPKKAMPGTTHGLSLSFPLYTDPENKHPVVDVGFGKGIAGRFPDCINAGTGALHMVVCNILPLKLGITRQKQHGFICTYDIHRLSHNEQSARSRLSMVTLADVKFQPETDHLVIPVSIPEIYLILRRTGTETFELVTSCVRLYDRERSDLTGQDLDFLAAKENRNAESWSTVGSTPDVHDVQMPLRTCVRSFRRILNLWLSYKDGRSPSYRDDREHTILPFFVWSIKESTSPYNRTEKAFLQNIITMCLAIHKDEDEWDKRGTPFTKHLQKEFLACVDRGFLRRVTEADDEQYITFIFDVENERLRGYFKRSNDLEAEALLEGARNPELPYWAWKYEDEKRWRDEEPLPRLEHIRAVRIIMAPFRKRRRMMVRTLARPYMLHLREYLWRVQEQLRRILTVFSEPPDLKTLADVIQNMKDRDGPDEYHSISMLYYMAGVRIDGRIMTASII
jgi:hypothetical protein